MKLRYLLFSMLALMGIRGQAQSYLAPVTPASSFIFEDLWNVTITSTDSSITYFKLRLELSENNAGTLLDVTSSPFSRYDENIRIYAGNLDDIMPFTFSYAKNTALANIAGSGGIFPAGTYTIKFTLYSTTDANSGTSSYDVEAENTTEHLSEHVLPVILMYVPDTDTIENKYPTFTWLPVSVAEQVVIDDNASAEDITYAIKVVKLLPDQSNMQAIQSNATHFEEEDITQPLLLYPVSAREFDDSGTYVWQVHAFRGEELLSSSEVWSFSYKKRPPVTPVGNSPLLKKEKKQNYYTIKQNSLNFAYYEEYAIEEGAKLSVRIYDEENKVYLDNPAIDLNVKKGMNNYSLSTCPEGLGLPDGVFTIEVTNIKGEYYYLRIIHTLDIGCN